ncbi:MAG: C45 family autoproteolytic acyltransferase/hydrolase [Cellulosilyticaceae bacterium]
MNTRTNKKLSLPIKLLIGLVVIIALAVGSVLFMFRNELKTLGSIERINDYPMYTMTYAGDYAFDDYLKIGAATDEEVLDFIIKTLLKGIPIEIELPNLGCSTMNAKTPEGDALFGRNFDLNYSPPMIVHTTPDNGYRSVSTVNLSFMGYSENYLPDDSFLASVIALAAPYVPIDGMNEKGLAVGILLIDEFELTRQDKGNIDLQTTTAVRMLLDKCATVEEAIAMLANYDMHSSAGSTFHFQIADATGDSAIVEYIDGEMSVIHPDEFYQACTNFIVTPGEYYGYGKGHDRYETMMNKLTETSGILTEEEMMDLLEAASAPLTEKEEGYISGTQWSVVYNLTDKTASIAVGMDYDTITDFDLTQTYTK